MINRKEHIEILLFTIHNAGNIVHVDIGEWEDCPGVWASRRAIENPTHWMPIPPIETRKNR